LDHPLVGGDDHDNWQQNHPNLISGDKHDNWKKGKKQHHKQKQMRHHNDWMKRQFNNDEVLPYLNKKLPDMM